MSTTSNPLKNVNKNNKQQPGTGKNDNNNNKNNNNNRKETKTSSTMTTKLQKELEILQRELEIAEYATVGHGHAKRKTPRRVMKERTKKRKLLERDDLFHANNDVDEDDDGHDDHDDDENDDQSNADANDRGVDDNSSHLLRGVADDTEFEEEEEIDIDEMEGNDVIDAEFEEDADVEIDEDEADDIDDDEDDEEEIEEDDNEEIDADVQASELQQRRRVESSKSKIKKKPPPNKTKPFGKVNSGRKSIQRKVRKRTGHYRMRNFKSHRMAERHGEALGAHARGFPLVAIKKLQQVAVDAPTAPQVYTSLGMIYEDMLKQEDSSNWKERLELAKKAYGSYHIAAVLCKKDYMVWVRAADTAREVADLYSFAMIQQQQHENHNDSPELQQHRALKRYWIQEAQKDYQSADNLKPPGLDVSAKLAAAHMELGNLSEALTIMTALKNRPGQTHRTWMLYAELMLRVGFECQQWNQGNENSMNFMFRRWLRKYSRSFDWHERRLQALALALEAAAGTASCSKLMQWTLERAKEKREECGSTYDDLLNSDGRWCMDSYETQPKEDVEPEEDGDADAPETPKDDPLDDDMEQLKFDTIRSALFSDKKLELEAFDQETTNAGSQWDNQRIGERATMVSRHRQAVVDFVGETLGSHQAAASADSRSEVLPIAASCATVCSIASELMKHCIGLEQYKGGRLVAECVSFYLKARAATRDKHVRFTLAFETKQKSTASEILLSKETYDEIQEENSVSDDDENFDYLSDEEAMDSDPHLLDHLNRGVLTPELQVLLALCLIGEGGQEFLASKCIDAISSLKDDTCDAIDLKVLDVDVVSRPEWQVYQHAMTDQLATIPALAFVADMLKSARKENQWAPKIAHIFQRAMDSFERSGLLEKALEAEKSKSSETALRRTQIIKIVLAGARYRVLQCKRQLLSTANPSKEAIACFQDVESVVRRLWQVDESGSPSRSSIKALQVFAQSLSLLDNAEKDQHVVLGMVEAFATRMVGGGPDPARSKHFVDEGTWLSFPFSSSWQDEGTRSLSLRVHNLCVANSVALFSGWEENEFTLDLMKRKRKNNYFGITLNEGRIVGYLDADLSSQLAEAWLAAAAVVGTTIDIADSIRKAAIFLHEDNRVARPPIDGEDIAIYGEKDALAVFLEYAKRCLLVASASDSKSEQSNMIQIAMSVLLPITQFSVLDAVWDSPLGRATGSLSGLDEWRTLVSSQPVVRTSEPPGPKPLRKQQKRSINQWHQTELSLVARIVVIPIKFLLAEWSRNENAASPQVPLLERQSKLHDAMCQLRMCTTELTLQKASLQVALVLLDMLPCVDNPFLVMQQAALFASQCSKGGSMDIHFKTELPPPHDCDPMQALTILARAECLQAVHFSREATYLCSYVARCCRMRRDESTNSTSGGAVNVAEQQQQRWTSQWKLIGIHAYNLAMATRSTICATQYDKDSQSKALEIWDDEVLGELERCRSDAIAMRKSTVGDHDGEEHEDDGADDDADGIVDNRNDDAIDAMNSACADDGADGIVDNSNYDAIDAMNSTEAGEPESLFDSEDSTRFAEQKDVCLGGQDDFVGDDFDNDESHDDCFHNDLVPPIEIVEV